MSRAMARRARVGHRTVAGLALLISAVLLAATPLANAQETGAPITSRPAGENAADPAASHNASPTPSGTTTPNATTGADTGDGRGADNATAALGTSTARKIADVTQALTTISAELERLEKAVERARTRDQELSRLRPIIVDLLAQATQLDEQLAPTEQDVASQVRRLGAPPKEGEPDEPPDLREERTRLTAVERQVATIRTASRVAQERARQLLDLIQRYRRTSFRDALFERSHSLASPALWRTVWQEGDAVVQQFSRLIGTWITSLRTDRTFLLTLLGFAIGVLATRWLRRWLIYRYRDQANQMGLDVEGRATSAVMVILARAVPTLIITGVAVVIIRLFSDVPKSLEQLIGSVFYAFAIFVIVRSVTSTVLAVSRPEWRLLALDDSAARRVQRLLVSIAAVFAGSLVLRQLFAVSYAPEALGHVATALISMALGLLMIALCRAEDAWTSLQTEGHWRLGPWWLRVPLLLCGIAIVVAAVLGYVRLAEFISSQVVLTGSIIAVAMLAQATVGEMARLLLPSKRSGDSYLQSGAPAPTLPGRLSERSAQVLRALLSVAIIVGAALLILLQWGFDSGDIALRARQAFFGFDVGAFRISVAAILIGAALFISGVFATRLLQRSLARTVLAPERMDQGLSHSINTALGYAGLALSALLAISYAGFNFTNLAIVAGALSVGIGFGLQSIVNNFVSGLILLAERPIQVGDWIKVGATEGYVRRISVRATVIETFDRANIIIPNSDLMTAAVTNWTYGSRLGRVVVEVGVSYDSDPQFVHDTLVEIGRNCSLALATPPPSVIFKDFAASTLNFALRIYIADINNVLRTQTELRMAIWKVFRERDISIDFPQLDVHLSRKPQAAPSKFPA